MSREQFARFKNQILGGTVLRDGNLWAEMLGDVDFEFWRNIHETEPYLSSGSELQLDNQTKGKVILERMEKETNPKRFTEMLQAVYAALTLYSAVPKNLGDGMWLTYVHRLQAERDATEFSDLEINWIKEPEVVFTREQLVERYYIPGVLKLTYVGEDWGLEMSQQILENGFKSDVIKRVFQEKKVNANFAKEKRPWYERPIGIVSLAAIATVVGGAILFFLRWS
jgi:hypothetical protein